MSPLPPQIFIPPVPTLLLLLSAGIIYYILSSIYVWHRLRAFNGPFVARFSYGWVAAAIASSQSGDWIFQVTRKYATAKSHTPTTVRVGPNDLLTTDIDFVRRMNGARSKYTRSNWYKLNALDPYHDNMFSIMETTEHDKVKAKVAAGYGGKEIPGLEGEIIDGMIFLLVHTLRNKYAVTRERKTPPMLDLASISQYFTLDTITKIAFGQAFGFLTSESDVHGYIQMILDIAPTITMSASIPYLAEIMSSKLVLSVMGPSPRDKKGVGKMMLLSKNLVSDRFGPDAKDVPDMMGSFIRHSLTKRECETEAIFQIVAGSDTTATAIRAIMLYVITTPRVYRRLQDEIDAGIKEGRISSPVITAAEGAEFGYLQAVIQEGLRLHPPFNGLNYKVVPPGGDYLDGVFVPAGTRIAPSHWAMMRNTSIFGEDADLFRPERWIEADPDKYAEMRKATDLCFGHGRWGCAGKVIAFMEMNKVFVELLRNFDFQLMNPTHPWRQVNYVLFMQRDMWVRVTARENKG
ncbi:cytochrome P450 [Podospora didyma]|uniref:Cytochrome P450 monooxygenase ABA1 n=1 Tax=Podospora didyma TaxID=330526 RepID=A0AAE0KAN5_9PEZI|nr:cytochrome P450 [Podospora didyma]